MIQKYCKCKNLFYLYELADPTDPRKLKCIDPAIHDCSLVTEPSYYIIEMYNNPKQCVQTCRTILSPDNKCMENIECPEDGLSFIPEEGSEQCVCKYNWYYVDKLKKVKKCLKKEEKCPENLKYVVKQTGQCVETCSDPEKYAPNIFLNYCYETCPKGKSPTGDKCPLPRNYYIKTEVPLEF